jgi:hypothetical protein
MLRRTSILALAAVLVMLAIASEAGAWGCLRVGGFRYGRLGGFRYGAVRVGGYGIGGYHYGYGGIHYGGYGYLGGVHYYGGYPYYGGYAYGYRPRYFNPGFRYTVRY